MNFFKTMCAYLIPLPPSLCAVGTSPHMGKQFLFDLTMQQRNCFFSFCAGRWASYGIHFLLFSYFLNPDDNQEDCGSDN